MALSGGGGATGGGIRAGKAYVELTLRDGVSARLAALQRKFESAGKGIAIGGAAGVAAGAAVLTPLLAAGKAALEGNTKIALLAERIGDTTENVSSLAYAMQQTGVSFDEMDGHFENFTERLKDAAAGGGEASDSFRRLNLDASAMLGTMSQTEQLVTTLDALGRMQFAAEKGGTASKFGGDQFMKLIPLANLGAEGIARLRKEAADVGAVLSGKDAKESVAVGKALNAAYTAAHSTFLALGTAVLPSADAMKGLQKAVTQGAAAVREYVRDNKEAVQAAVLVGAALVVGGTAFVALGTTLAAVAVATGGFVAALSAAAGFAAAAAPWVFLAGAVGATGAQLEAVQAAARVTGRYFAEMWGNIKATFVGVGDALRAGDLKLAGQVALAGLEYEWQKGMAAIQSQWNNFNANVTESFRAGWVDCKLAWDDFQTSIDLGMSRVKQTFSSGWRSVTGGAIDAMNAMEAKLAAIAAPVSGAFDRVKSLLPSSVSNGLDAAASATPPALAAAALAAANQGLKDATGYGTTDPVKDGAAARAKIEADRAARQGAIRQDAAAAAAARQAARDAALAGANAAADLAGFTSLILRGKAAALAAFAGIGSTPGGKPGIGYVTPEVGKSVKGAFAVGNAQQVFGGDNAPVVSAIKALTEALDANRKALEQKRDAKNYIDVNVTESPGVRPAAVVRFA